MDLVTFYRVEQRFNGKGPYAYYGGRKGDKSLTLAADGEEDAKGNWKYNSYHPSVECCPSTLKAVRTLFRGLGVRTQSNRYDFSFHSYRTEVERDMGFLLQFGFPTKEAYHNWVGKESKKDIKKSKCWRVLKYEISKNCIARGESQCVYITPAARVIAEVHPATLEPIWSN